MPQILHTKDIGSITAYGDALAGGYTGTKESLMSIIAAIANGAMLVNVGYKTVTLSVSSWNDGKYDLSSVLPTNRYSILAVDMDCDNISGTQIAAWYDADISFDDGNVLTAHKNVPEIDIPIVVVYQSMDATLEVPTYSGSLTYDGTLQQAVFDGYNDEVMTIGGVYEATNAGNYTATFKPKEGYRWTDGTKSAVSVEWGITKDALTAPTLKSGLVYDGTEQDIIDSTYDATKISVSGNTQTNAGDYEVTISIADKTNYEWGDTHTTADKVIAWFIEKVSVTAPTVTADLTYDGTEQSATVSAYDATIISVTGTTGANAGDYTATIALIDKNNYEWPDETTADIEIAWSIAKAAGSITLSADSVELSDDVPSTVVAATATGEVSAASSDDSIVTATVSGNDITIALAEQGASGAINVTAESAENSNYSSASAVLSVRANFSIPSWADGTDAEIADILARHYAGNINLHDYWEIGDEREISFDGCLSYSGVSGQSAQKITMVLLNKGGKTLSNSETECAFIVGMKECFPTKSKLSTSSAASWATAGIKGWCEYSFRPAIPESIRNIFLEHDNISYNTETINTTEYFTLPSLYEVLGGTYMHADGEQQLEYYKNADNQKKNLAYYTRTSTSTVVSNSKFVVIKTDGATEFLWPNASSNYMRYISVQGVI